MPRTRDLYAALPSITGKMELEYEGELHGSEKIARETHQRRRGTHLQERAGGADVEEIVAYFEEGGALQVSEDAVGPKPAWRHSGSCRASWNWWNGWGSPRPPASPGFRAAACELVLEALVAERRISRTDAGYARPPFEIAWTDRPDPSEADTDVPEAPLGSGRITLAPPSTGLRPQRGSGR